VNGPSQVLVIRADRVMSSGPRGSMPGGAVVVRDGRIAWVGPDAELGHQLEVLAQENGSQGSRPRVLDFGHATVTPGLIDTHVHLTLFADRRFYEAMAAEPDELMALVAVRNLHDHLRAGITSVRDNGGRNQVIFRVREALRRGYFPGPRLVAAGRPVTQTGGHFHWCNGEADGVEEVRRQVRLLVSQGADHIKLMASGGGTVGSERDHPALTYEEMREAVETAHALGRLTTAHCHATAAIENAIAAGVDCIEHAEFNLASPRRTSGAFTSASARFEHQDMVYDPSVTARILERGINISFTPQAGGYEFMLDLREQAASSRLSDGDRRELQGLERKFSGRVEILSRLLQDGIGERLSISSDAGCFDGSFGRLYLGLGLALDAGMSPHAAIDAVTVNAARICGVDHVVGSLDAGLLADIAVFEGDLERGLDGLRQPRAVYQEGALVSGWEPAAVPASRLVGSVPAGAP
jgi:imidazolonepropionase-like amidohydrolase